MKSKLFIISCLLWALFGMTSLATDFELEAKVKALILRIDYSGDGQADPKSLVAKADLNAMNRADVMDALVALHNKSYGNDSTPGEAIQSSRLRAYIVRQLDLWGAGATQSLELARSDFDRITRHLLLRKEKDDLRVAPFEIESMLRILVFHGTSQDIERIRAASKALSDHHTTLSDIWAQSIQSDLEMLENDKRGRHAPAAMQPDQISPPSDFNPKTNIGSSASKSITPTPSEEPASSTPWSIIVVLIVAACGMLWLLLKRRS